MARMIPPTVHSGTTSPGEREVFHRLKDDPETKNWIVLHSLDVANHHKQISGEADFLIIVPKKGVLCLEVKACHHVRREEGLWYYRTSSQPDARGPFKQATEAMHSIRKRVVERRPDLAEVVFWSAVMFPYLTFTLKSDEWHSWQVVDSSGFRTQPIARLIEGILDQARMFLAQHPSGKWFDPASDEPTLAQCQLIADVLRPDFEFFESPKSREHRLQAQLKYYTAEQFAAIDAMENNARVAFCGPAGTGKTMLAIETARRSVAAGRQVLFLCFNRLLGKWLEEQTAELGPTFVCKTLHSHMLAVASIHPTPQPAPEFWDSELPRIATERLLLEEGDQHSFDELVLDEAQDLMRDDFLDFLDLSLRGGLASGRWRFFGDFEKQAIYGSANVSLSSFLATRGAHAPQYALRLNCRNTPRVAELVRLLAGLSPGYSKVLRPDDRVDPQLLYYATPQEAQEELITTLNGLFHTGYSGHEVVVLSPRSDSSCLAKAITQSQWKDRLRRLEAAGRGHIGYTSIHAYKGLEAPVVIVTDIDHIDAGTQSLFYVAVTRAVDRLILLLHENVKNDIRRLLGMPYH